MKIFQASGLLLLIILLIACSDKQSKPPAVDAVSASSIAITAQATANFSGRFLHQVVAWQNKLWLIGGRANDGDKNDIWSSTDGVHWLLETASAAFSPRAGHQVVVYDNKLWLIGGSVSGKFMSDVWFSSDGIHWLPQTASAAFSPRAFHQVVAYQNKLWLVGGRIGELSNKDGKLVGMSNDVWSSSDGIHWSQLTAEAAFLPRLGHHLVVFHNKLWLMGGFNLGDLGEVWSSQDGIQWAQETATAEFGFRNFSALVSHHDQLWLIGGSTLDKSQEGDSLTRSDVWSSADGIHWLQKTANAGFAARWGMQAVSFKRQMFVVGGDISSGEKGVTSQAQNDRWTTFNGVEWSQID